MFNLNEVNCIPPFKGVPNKPWKMECKGNNNPKWKSPSWAKRDDFNCYYCPGTEQRGKKVPGRKAEKVFIDIKYLIKMPFVCTDKRISSVNINHKRFQNSIAYKVARWISNRD